MSNIRIFKHDGSYTTPEAELAVYIDAGGTLDSVVARIVEVMFQKGMIEAAEYDYILATTNTNFVG